MLNVHSHSMLASLFAETGIMLAKALGNCGSVHAK
jgi:hypothetical protein